jgi:hypothetical protein
MGVLTSLLSHVAAVPLIHDPALRWPRYAFLVLMTWFVARVLLPDAWHYRREDSGGLLFVLFLLAACLCMVWLT